MNPKPCAYCGRNKAFGGTTDDGFAWYYCPVCDKLDKIEK